MLRQSNAVAARRDGVILLVVLALLTLFAIIGISLVLYSSSQADSSRMAREGAEFIQADMDSELLFAFFLGQLVYDVDDVNGVYSAVRGHSLARTMYGLNCKITGNPPAVISPGANSLDNNTQPYNGPGRIHSWNSKLNQDEFSLINYTYFGSLGEPLRDPERIGPARGNPAQPYSSRYVGFNAPYTYPDLNNMFLAAVRADGTVLMPSFHRHWLFNDTGRTLDDRNNSNWTSPQGKYLTLRPRPQEMSAEFPFPEDPGGDVKNLMGSPGSLINGKYYNNDSIWVDLGAPVMTAPDGTRFKPLFAPLVVDLDNRVNVNVHGNIRGRDPFSNSATANASNQGWGPWEVSLQWVLNRTDATNAYEWPNVFLGNNTQVAGRYGTDGKPAQNMAASIALLQPLSRFYAQVDLDGCDERGGYIPTSPFALPATTSLTPFPTFPEGYGNASPFLNGAGPPYERTDHPAYFNFFQPGADDRILSIGNLEALLRYGDTGSPALTSDLFRLCPVNFGDARIRNLVTSHSFDLDRPGVPPWLWDPAAQPYQLDLRQIRSLVPWGSSAAFPALDNDPPANSEFGSDSRARTPGWQSLFKRLDLNRPLTDYPPADSNGVISPSPQLDRAIGDRQLLAADIFQRLQAVTGSTDVASSVQLAIMGQPQQFNAIRALAQLAVNIVDFIDNDDYMTPFNWYGSEWVLGTELPRLVINEVYAEITNDPGDPNPPRGLPASTQYDVNFWVELHNPLSPAGYPDQVLSDGGLAVLQASPTSYPGYELVISAQPDPLTLANPSIRLPQNVLGDPDQGQIIRNPGSADSANNVNTANNVKVIVSSFTPDPTVPQPIIADYNLVKPANGAFGTSYGSNWGFSVLGPKYAFPYDPTRPSPTPPQATLRVQDVAASKTQTGIRSSLSYEIPASTPLTFLPGHGLLLRRLACPKLPPQLDSNKAYYNPYVTVDYVESIPTNDAVLYDHNGQHSGYKAYESRQSFGRNQPYSAHATQQNAQKPSPASTNQPQHTLFRHNAVEQKPPLSVPNPTLRLPFDWLVHLDRPLISAMELLQVSAYKPHELTQQFMTFGSPNLNQRAPWWDEDIQTGGPISHRLFRAFEFLRTGPRSAGVAAGGRFPGMININTVWDPEVLLALCDPQESNVFGPGDVYNVGDPYDLSTIYGQLMHLRTPGFAAGGSPGPNDQPFSSLAAGKTMPGDSQYPGGMDVNNTLLASAIVTIATQDVPAGTQQLVMPSSMKGLIKGQSWAIQSGSMLLVDTGANREMIQVLGVTDSAFTADFSRPHAAGFSIAIVGDTPRLFQVAAHHPYLQDQLLTKIFNQTTTRSNVFAVWLTVGFFKVVDENSRPVKLGAEIGRSENRHIRHRMFAIVDRSNLTIDASSPGAPGPPPIFLTGITEVSTPGANVTVNVESLSGSYEGIPWQIQQGTQLLADIGPEQELITVTQAKTGNPSWFSATFNKPHSAGFSIVVGPLSSGTVVAPGLPGNPGPQSRLDLRSYPAVIRYFSIIN